MMRSKDAGYALITVLVLLLVLGVTAFFSAALTRTNVQVVNNLQNEKEAFSIAEAGINEALYRLSIPNGYSVTVDGVAFDPSVAPKTPDRSVSQGASSYGIDSVTPTSTTQILFNGAAPATGTNNTTPSLQPAALRMNYSTSTADGGVVNLNTTGNLSIGWDVCGSANPTLGCDPVNTFYPIRGLPANSPHPRPVVKIVSTGSVRRPDQSVVASRKITGWATDNCDPGGGPADGSIITTGTGCGSDNGISMNGNSSITAAGMVQVNAGATSDPPSSCTAAQTGNNPSSSIQASDINVVGGTEGNFTPTADTGVLPMTDPYAAPILLPPCYTGGPLQCQGPLVTTPRGGSPLLPAPVSVGNNGTLNPGIYYGGIRITGSNVTMQPGTYIIAGGGFSVATGTTSVSSAAGGVFIYNTQNPDPTGVILPDGPAASFDITNGSCSASLASPTSGTFAGVVLFQDRALSPQPDIFVQGGTTGTRVLDGLVYAPSALMHIQGTNDTILGGSLIVQGLAFNGGSDLTVTNSTTTPTPGDCGGIAYLPVAWQDF